MPKKKQQQKTPDDFAAELLQEEDADRKARNAKAAKKKAKDDAKKQADVAKERQAHALKQLAETVAKADKKRQLIRTFLAWKVLMVQLKARHRAYERQKDNDAYWRAVEEGEFYDWDGLPGC